MAGGFTTAYANLASGMSIGEAFTPYNNANAYLGVGDSGTAFAIAQTDLQGSSTLRRGMAVGYPNRVDANTVEFRAEFGETDANFAWLENGLFNDATTGTMMYRDAENLGTKANGTIWVLTKTISWTQS